MCRQLDSAKVVGDQPLRNKDIRLPEFAHQFHRGLLVSLGMDQHIEHLALSVDGQPKVDYSAIDFQIDLAEKLSRVRLQATLSWSAAIIDPTPNGLVGRSHSAPRQ